VDAEEPPGDALEKGKVSLADVVIELDPREEWRQIYYEGWRHMRDFHWDPGMSGLDWKAVRDRYAALLPRLGSREDLRDLMGEVIGELATSHTYVWGGDPGVEVPQVGTGLLGADVAREDGAWRVARIFRGDPADCERSPLSEPEAAVREGEYLLAVNNRPFPSDRPFEAAFEGLAGREVLLTVGDRPRGSSRSGRTRQVVVTTLEGDRGLRYADWVRRNREYVSERTGGRIGYLHIPDMQEAGMIEFDTWFYTQLDREGMVVDARWNGGGFVSQLIVERLRRKIVSFDRSRAGGVWPYPYRTLNGPFVVLTNQFAGSDGDIFPMAVQLEGLAPVIGKRSWGGVIGIRADKPMTDGGILTQPEFAWWDPKQGWALENRGVVPDIEIEDLPQDLARGVDAQLDRAIEEVLRLHAERPPLRPAFGPEPDKSREAFERRER
jgi:tricorn protease